jgi:hypothetical protein
MPEASDIVSLTRRESTILLSDRRALVDSGQPPARMAAQDRIMPRISRRYSIGAPARLPIGARTLLIGGLILVALSGAFLLGLAVVGLLAAAIGGLELARRHFGRKPLGAFDQQDVRLGLTRRQG